MGDCGQARCYDSHMTRRVRRILYVLLFALVCGLGDGPFLDELEVMTDGQQQVQMAAQGDRANADQPAALMVLYATLMSAADVSSFPSVVRTTAAQRLPIHTTRTYTDPALAPPAEPPRSALA